MFFSPPLPSHRLLLWTAFISGTSLMALEINASRILAPYFGTSLFVWTSIIGVVLLALSLGYYYGGKLADRFPEARVLFGLILGVGIWLAILPWVSNFLLALFLHIPNANVFSLSLISATILFLPPCTAMGMVSPYVLKLYSKKHQELGQEAGNLYAISTIGSLIGTFLPALVTIPLLGSLKTTLLFAFLLLITAAIGFRNRYLYVLPIVVVLLFAQAQQWQVNAQTIYQTESSYNFIRVLESGETRYLQINDPRAVHSLKKSGTLLTNNYWDFPAVIPFYAPTEKALILGLAGGNISSLLSNYFPDMEITGVEIDPVVTETAKRFFDLEKPNLNIVTDDARAFLQNTTDKYDFIAMDAYHDLSIPVHLATKEFYALASKHLNENGVFMVNAAHYHTESSLDDYFAATLKSIFPFVYSIDTNKGYNTMFIAMNTPWPGMNVNPLVKHPELKHIIAHFPPQEVKNVDLQKVQTDDRNILELLASKDWLKL